MEKSYSNISENLKRLRFEIGESIQKYGRGNGGVKLMAVTKTIPVEAVNEAVRLGVDLLGENKAQELLLKYDGYDKNVVKIHFIGHLQSNKVRQIIGKVSMIESVDGVSLAREIDKQSHKNGIKTDVLVEVNIGGEASKFGVFPQRLEELLAELSNFPHIAVKGLMAIPPFSDDVLQTEKYFSAMHELFVDIRGKNIDNVSMDVLSMGMSGDFKEAIKHGSNIIRIGTALFGARDYS
ncbi:MAG: YggS family pyridoxal phosphate-dependent enzyme [Oscillospiraceae bacterium]|nr:YggS family pyridoxal phosphate-dependent enzyme [Oscillospiraceae bacterium]